MKEIIVRTVGADGEFSSGCIVVRTGIRHASAQRHLLDMALEAAKAEPVGSARRTELADLVHQISEAWPLKAGRYPLNGRAAIVIDDNTLGTFQQIRAERDFRAAQFGGSGTRSPASEIALAAKIAKARAALGPRKSPHAARAEFDAIFSRS